MNEEKKYTRGEVMKYFEYFSDLSQQYSNLRLSQTCMNSHGTNSEKSKLTEKLKEFSSGFDEELVKDLSNNIPSFRYLLNNCGYESNQKDRYVPTKEDMKSVGKRLLEMNDCGKHKVALRFR